MVSGIVEHFDAAQPASGASSAQTNAARAATSISQRNRRGKAAQVCRSIEALTRNVDLKAAQTEFLRYQTKWQELVDDADEQLEQQFYRACEAFETHVAHSQKALAAQQQAAEQARSQAKSVTAAPAAAPTVSEGSTGPQTEQSSDVSSAHHRHKRSHTNQVAQLPETPPSIRMATKSACA